MDKTYHKIDEGVRARRQEPAPHDRVADPAPQRLTRASPSRRRPRLRVLPARHAALPKGNLASLGNLPEKSVTTALFS